MVETVRRCGAVEALALQHVDHAEHAVHRRTDLVAHGGEEGRLRLIGGFRLGAFLLGGVARVFGGLLGAGERLLAGLEHRDVAIDAEQPAVAQGTEIELDVFARGDRLLVARAAGTQDAPRDLGDGLLDVLGRSELAVLGKLAHDVEARHAAV